MRALLPRARPLVAALIALVLLAPTGAAAQESDSSYLVAAGSVGDVMPVGGAPFHGSLADTDLEVRVVDIAETPSGGGYWLTTDEGGVHAFGDAGFHGSLAGTSLAEPIVAMVSTPTGEGYWLFAADGGVFTFGDATFHGSLGDVKLVAPIVSAAVAPGGYWLFAADGGVFSFGDATFHGSLGGVDLVAPVRAADATEDGYLLVAADGGVFTFGDATFHGSLGDGSAPAPIIDLVASGDGYWIAGEDGSIHAFGTAAPLEGVAAGAEEPVVGVAVHPDGSSGWLVTTPRGSLWEGVPLPDGSGEGRRIVYSNSAQRIWLVDADGEVADSWLVSGRRSVPRPGTYSVFSKSRHAFAGHDGITMEYMVRFARGARLAIGFHSIPTYANGRPMQTEAELGTFQSAGCVRQRLDQARQLYAWAPVGTTVVVLP